MAVSLQSQWIGREENEIEAHSKFHLFEEVFNLQHRYNVFSFDNLSKWRISSLMTSLAKRRETAHVSVRRRINFFVISEISHDRGNVPPVVNVVEVVITKVVHSLQTFPQRCYPLLEKTFVRFQFLLWSGTVSLALEVGSADDVLQLICEYLFAMHKCFFAVIVEGLIDDLDQRKHFERERESEATPWDACSRLDPLRVRKSIPYWR